MHLKWLLIVKIVLIFVLLHHQLCLICFLFYFLFISYIFVLFFDKLCSKINYKFFYSISSFLQFYIFRTSLNMYYELNIHNRITKCKVFNAKKYNHNVLIFVTLWKFSFTSAKRTCFTKYINKIFTIKTKTSLSKTSPNRKKFALRISRKKLDKGKN